RFFQAAGWLAERTDLWLVLVVRDDFLGRLLRHDDYFPGNLGALYWVPPLSVETGRRIVAETWATVAPAPGDDLVEQILREASDSGAIEAGMQAAARDSRTLVPLILQAAAHFRFDSEYPQSRSDGSENEAPKPKKEGSESPDPARPASALERYMDLVL